MTLPTKWKVSSFASSSPLREALLELKSLNAASRNRRAGWLGCNLAFNRILADARILTLAF